MKFIAEVSSNHNRDLNRCFKFIEAASASGCHAVKFQLFKINQLFAKEILEISKEHRRRQEWELPVEFIKPLSEYCHKLDIEFGCTPFYIEAVKELEEYVDFYKIASYELLWDDLLRCCAQTSKPVILSTGMSTIEEIKHAVDVLRKNGCKHPTLLHCTSAYPTPHDETNLKAIKTIREETGCKVGWSDHTVKSSVLQRAFHKWNADVIEFHLDLDRSGDEYESGHCWLPDDIGRVISEIKQSLESDGNGIKTPTASELSDRVWRADPEDGLRPMKTIRKSWQP